MPLLPGFDFLASDARFIGHPVDYIVFHGYTNLRDGGGSTHDLEIFILDIKRNMPRLTSEQMAIARAVQAGRVRFRVVRVEEDGTLHTYTFSRRERPIIHL